MVESAVFAGPLADITTPGEKSAEFQVKFPADSSKGRKKVLFFGIAGTYQDPFSKRSARCTGRRGTETAELALEGPGTVVRAAEPLARDHGARRPLVTTCEIR